MKCKIMGFLLILHTQAMITIHDNYNLLRHNTFRIDATCTRWIDYDDPADLHSIAEMVEDQRYFNIGCGSNIVLYPRFDGTMLHSLIRDVTFTPFDDYTATVRAGAGCRLDDLTLATCEQDLWGLENLSLIPGTVGAAVVQNAGAYGVEIKDLVQSVECYDLSTRTFLTLPVSECEFGYRESVFKQPQYRSRVITHVTLRLSTVPKPHLGYGDLAKRTGVNPTAMKVRQAVIDTRREKLPDAEHTGSAGSFFKNPVITPQQFQTLLQLHRKYHGADAQVPHYPLPDGNIKVPAAWLLDRCGFKGRQMGNVSLWPTQPLVLVNATGKATGPEISDITQYIADKVFETYGIKLHTEVEFV